MALRRSIRFRSATAVWIGAAVGWVATASAQLCGNWTEVPASPAATGAVVDVSAISADDAWALSTSSGPIRWDGAVWNDVAAPDLSGMGSAVSLDALMTLDPTFMAIAGVVVTGTWTTEQLLLTWDGSDWDRIESVELAPNIMGAPRYGAPRDMDGVSSDDIWIVGTASGYGDGVNGAPVLTVHWDGSTLTEVLTPGVGNRQNHLYAVSMVAPDDGWAVGYYNNTGDGGAFHAMVYHYDGSSWTHVPTPAEAMDSTHLYDVVALASDDVWAAGETASGPLFMHWDGSAWSIFPSPPVPGTIQKLAAIGSNDIWAVDTPWAVPIEGKFYHWDGLAWSVVSPPEIPGATQVSRHGGLAAVGSCDVWAVGSQYDGQVLSPLIERLSPSGGVVSVPQIGNATHLFSIRPNPMQRSAAIRLTTGGDDVAGIRIFDARGSLVRTLSGGQGRTRIWDGANDDGQAVPAGVYFVRVATNAGEETRKLIVTR